MSGLFNSMKKELNSAANSISKDIDSIAKKAGDKWDEHATSPLLDHFRTGNVLQLISRSSGRSLEIVTAQTGQLVVDGCGPEGPNHMHTQWTVFNDGRNIVRLHNSNNYLTIVNGAVLLQQFVDPSLTGPHTRFRLHQINNQFVSLESDKEPHRHAGVMNNGQLKPAIACGREIDGQWAVRLIYSPYQNPQPRPGQVTNTTHVVRPQPGSTVVVTTTTTRKQ